MSWVSNVILATATADSDRLADVNSFFESPGNGFVSVADPTLPQLWYGGTKHLEVVLALGAFNHLDLGGLVKHLRQIKWTFPNQVELLVRAQEADGFRVLVVFPEHHAI